MTVRILHVLQSSEGGGPAHAVHLARRETDVGFDVTLAVPAPGTRARVATATLPAGFARRARALWRLAQDADLVHVHGTRAAAWSLHVLERRPSIVTFHGLHPLRREAGPTYRAAARALVRAQLAAADAAICVSRAEAHDLEALWIPSAKVHVVRNAVPAAPQVSASERAAARTALRLAPHAYVVLFVGRLQGPKDPLTAVDAVRGVDCTLLVAGDGELRSEVQAHAASNVSLLGHRDDVRVLLAAADVLLSTSRWEGLPLGLLEAMWAGVPAVVSAVPGNVEAVGDVAVAVAPGDVVGFRAALDELREDSRRAELARRGRERVEREFSFERMLAETQAVYEAVLAR